MKLVIRILSVVAFAGLATFYTSCKPDENNKTTEEKQLEKLTQTWSLVSANDGTDRTADFPNLVLTVSGSFAQDGTYNYSFTGTRPNPSPWPVSGTWKFGTDPTTQLIRDPSSANEIDMFYDVSDTSLEISFNVPDTSTGWPGGRATSVSGDWVFTFQKQ